MIPSSKNVTEVKHGGRRKDERELAKEIPESMYR
jgi:hypothetical protein